jgi:hypothetical protein
MLESWRLRTAGQRKMDFGRQPHIGSMPRPGYVGATKVGGVARIPMELLQCPKRQLRTALPYRLCIAAGFVYSRVGHRRPDFRDEWRRLGINSAVGLDQASKWLEPRFQPPVGLGLSKPGEPPKMPPIRAPQIAAEPQRQLLRCPRTGRLVEHLAVLERDLKVPGVVSTTTAGSNPSAFICLIASLLRSSIRLSARDPEGRT